MHINESQSSFTHNFHKNVLFCIIINYNNKFILSLQNDRKIFFFFIVYVIDFG